jgi:hypothetical protein
MSKERAPIVLLCTAEAFRMYNTFCAGAKEETGQEKKRKKAKETVFSSRTPAFFLAAAIGIINDKTGEVKKEKMLTRREFIVNHANYDPFSQLVKSKYDVKTEQEIVDKLLEFQEAGIRELYDEFHKTGTIDFLRIYRDAKSHL